MTRAIQLEIPGDRLPDLLAGRARIEGIPEGAHLRAAFWMGNAWPDREDGDSFVVSIEHESLPEVPAGRRIPRHTASIAESSRSAPGPANLNRKPAGHQDGQRRRKAAANG